MFNISFILDNINDPIYLVNRNGYLKYVNKKACDFLGYSFQNMLKMHVKDISSSFKSDFQQDNWDKIKNQKSIIFNYQLKTTEGKLNSVNINAKFFVFNHEEYNLCILNQINPEKNSEKVVFNESLFKRIIETSNQGIMAINANNIITFANKKIIEMLKYDESFILNQDLLKLYLKDDLESFNQKVENRKKFKSEIFERRLKTGDVKIIWTII